MTHTITVTGELVTQQCPSCGVLHAYPQALDRLARQNGSKLYCPNGHWYWFGEGESDKLRRENNILKQQQARLEDERREAARLAEDQRQRAVRAEAETKRLKKRAVAGTCPCCARTFSNLAEHMKHQHPEAVRESGAKVVRLPRRKTGSAA